MSMDGFILATDELPSPQGSYMKLGPSNLCSAMGYVFPIGASIDITMFRLHSTKRLLVLKEAASIANDLIQNATCKKQIKQNKFVIENLKGMYDQICERMKMQTNPRDCFTMLRTDGTLLSGRFNYSYSDVSLYGMKDVDLNIEYSDLFIGKGTQWVISDCIEDAMCLEAALRCCDSKEDLLLLLRKIGAISVGQWMTPIEYLDYKQVAQNCEEISDRLFTQTHSNVAKVVALSRVKK